jgi:hypothetical protein
MDGGTLAQFVGDRVSSMSTPIVMTLALVPDVTRSRTSASSLPVGSKERFVAPAGRGSAARQDG